MTDANPQPIVLIADQAMRLDKYVAQQLSQFSRSQLQKWIIQGRVHINNTITTDVSHALRVNDRIIIHPLSDEAVELHTTTLPLSIIADRPSFLVINKPAGLSVHPGAGQRQTTLADILFSHCGSNLSTLNGAARPGIVHRLDKDTSGLLVIAKTNAAHRALTAQFADKTLHRTYMAWAWGAPHWHTQRIETIIGRHPHLRQKMAVLPTGSERGKHAITHVTVDARYAKANIVRLICRLETGRTHQIRVHLQHIGLPMVGDATYGKTHQQLKSLAHHVAATFPRQALHAFQLSLKNPDTNQIETFEAPWPKDVIDLDNSLQSVG